MSDKPRRRFYPKKETLLKSGGYIVPTDTTPQKRTIQKIDIPLEIQNPFSINLKSETENRNREQKGLLVDDILSNVEDFERAESIDGEDNVINPEVPVYYGMHNMGTKKISSYPEEATGNTSANILEDIKKTVENVKKNIVKGLVKDEAFKQYKEGKLQLPLTFDAGTIVNEVLFPSEADNLNREEVAKYLGIETSLPGMSFFGGIGNVITELGNIGRIGYNKLFDGDIQLTETSNYRVGDKLHEQVLDILGNAIGGLIPLSSIMKTTDISLQTIKNPAVRNALTNMISFTAMQQPELMSGWLQGKVTTDEYIRENMKSGLMGLTFSANPYHTPELSGIKGSRLSGFIYNALVPALSPQVYALGDEEFDTKRYVEDVLLNAGLDIIMHGRMIRRVSRDINTLKAGERNPETIKRIVDNAVMTEPVGDTKARTLKEIDEGFRVKRKLANREFRRKTTEVPETNTNEPGKGDFMNWNDEAMRVELRRLGFRNKDIAKMHKDNKLFLISGGRYGKEWTGRGPEEIKIQNKEEIKVGDKIRSDNYKNPKEQLEVTDIRNDNMIKVKDEAGNEGLIGINGLKKIVEKPSINSLADEYIKKNKNYISQDEARELFKDEGYDRSNPDPKFTKPAWEVVDKVFEKKIKELRDNNVKGKVMITAGAPGSGKTTMAKELGSSKKYKLILDTNISDINETEKRINKIKEAGLEAEIYFVYTKPEKITRRMFERVEEGGHLVKMEKQAGDYIKSIENIKTLKEKIPELKIKVLDNSTEGKWKEIGIDEVKLYDYNEVTKILENESGKLRKQSLGYERIYRAYTEQGGNDGRGRRSSGSIETGSNESNRAPEAEGNSGTGREAGITKPLPKPLPEGEGGVNTLRSELDAAIKENKPVDLNKYTAEYLSRTFKDIEIKDKATGKVETSTSESKPFDQLYRQAREHNYNLNKKIIGDALKDMNLDFGGISKLSDITQPKVLKAVYDVAGYHYDKLRTLTKDSTVKFGKWAKAMTDELGGKVRKHLETLWKEVKAYFTGKKSFTDIGLSMGFPPPKDNKNNNSGRPDHTEKIRMDAIGKVAELVNKYSKEIEAEGKVKNDIDLLERVRQKVRKDIHNLEEFRKLTSSEREKVIEAVGKFYKMRAREVLNVSENPFLPEFTEFPNDNRLMSFVKPAPRLLGHKTIRQSSKMVAKMGKGGEEIAERINKMHDDERDMMGVPSRLYLEYKMLSGDEKIEFNRIRNKMMLEEAEPLSIKSERVKILNNKFNEYYRSVAKEAEDLSMETYDISTNQKRDFHGREVYDPRILDEAKLQKLYPDKKSKGRSGLNRIREINDKAERVYQYMIDTKQAKDRADAIDKLNKYMAKRTQVAKAGNLEFSRIDNVRLPEEYYISNPLERLVKYSTKISRRIAHAKQFGIEGDIASSLLDKIKTDGYNEPFVRELLRYETGNLTDKEITQMGWVNPLKSIQAITKFSPFTTLRNSLQGFLGSTTRGNLKAGVQGLLKGLLDRQARIKAYESGALADTIESVVMKEFGGENNFTSKYLTLIGFTQTDRINRVISSSAGEIFYKDMLSRIKRDSILKGRALREFKKIGLDPELVVKRGEFTEAEINMIRRKFAGDSQFNIRPSDLPLFWSSPMGKLVTQWKPFGYKMTQLISENVFKELKHGNVLPLITFLAAYNIGGEAVNILIDSVRSIFNFNPYKDDKEKESITDKMVITRISRGNWDKVASRIIDNLSGLGALSMFVDVYRGIGYGKSPTGDITAGVSNYLLGPTLSTGVNVSAKILGPLIGMKWFDDEDTKGMDALRKTALGIYNMIFTNIPGAGIPRTLGLTKMGEDWLKDVLGVKKKKKRRKNKK